MIMFADEGELRALKDPLANKKTISKVTAK